MLEFTNNDIYTPITGDIVKSSGQNYGYLLALANGTTNSQSLIGVVQKASTPGYVGQVETKGLLTVNCTEEPTVGAALYLSSVTRGKATRVVVAGEIGIGACVSKSYTGSYWKADLEWSPVDGSAAQNQALYQGTAPAGGVSIVGGIVIPDSLDPSVSGFTAAIGTVITSVSGLLAWKKWGAVDTNWIALHPTKGTTVAPSTNLDIPLYCESAGGFRLVLENIDVTSAVGNPTIRLRVNGADVADANSLFWSVRWTGAAWFTTDIVYAGSMFLGGVGSYLTVGEYCRATIECQLPQIAIGRRRLSTDSVRRLGTAAQAIVPLHMDSYPANGAELTSIGIAVTGGTAQLATGISWRLERLP